MKNVLIILATVCFTLIAMFTGMYIYENIGKGNTIDSNLNNMEFISSNSIKNLVVKSDYEDECTVFGEIYNEYNTVENITTDASNLKVSPNAILIIEKYYKQCGHNMMEEVLVPYDIINMNKEDVINRYKGWEIKEFDSKKVIIYKEFDANCNEHYVIKEENGEIKIYKEKDDKTLEFKQVTDIIPDYLTEHDLELLRNGVRVYGEQELSSALEDLNS